MLQKNTALPPLPLSQHTQIYNCEAYIFEEAIPKLQDPLPYRKPGSVFATGEEGMAVMTSAKNDPRLRTIVCRHWLKGLCMKGEACEFLHQYNLEKMPLCRNGDRCKVPDCPFRHIKEADRMECVFYRQGFCIHGPFCRYKHVPRPVADIPQVGNFTLGLTQMQDGKSSEITQRQSSKPNEFYKVSLCKHYAAGNCPFGDGCHFAHGEDELKSYADRKTGLNDDGEVDEDIFSKEVAEEEEVDYYEGQDFDNGGSENPGNDGKDYEFFCVAAASYEDLAYSVCNGEWFLSEASAKGMMAKSEKEEGKEEKEERKKILFFTVSDSRYIQGCAVMVTQPTLVVAAEDSAQSSLIDPAYPYRVAMTWLRTVELSQKVAISNCSTIASKLPSQLLHTSECISLSLIEGDSLLTSLWACPRITLYENTSLLSQALAQSNPVDTPQCSQGGFKQWPLKPGPSYVFPITTVSMGEALLSGVLSLPSYLIQNSSHIVPGTALFLYNIYEGLLYGVFEAISTPVLTTKKVGGGNRTRNSLDIRFKIHLECPPLQASNPLFVQVFRSRKSNNIRVGTITSAQASALATILAMQCGAMGYMNELKETVGEGRAFKEPPVAIPSLAVYSEEVKRREAVVVAAAADVAAAAVKAVEDAKMEEKGGGEGEEVKKGEGGEGEEDAKMEEEEGNDEKEVVESDEKGDEMAVEEEKS